VFKTQLLEAHNNPAELNISSSSLSGLFENYRCVFCSRVGNELCRAVEICTHAV